MTFAKWSTALALLAIVRVAGMTIVFDDGSQLIAAGPALPHVGAATVAYHDCAWWTAWTVCQATITQDGISYEAVQ